MLELGMQFLEHETGNIYQITGTQMGSRQYEICIREPDGSRTYIQNDGMMLLNPDRFEQIS